MECTCLHQHTLCWSVNVSSTMKKIIIWMLITMESGLESRVLASRLNHKVSSELGKHQSQLPFSFNFWLPLAYMKANAILFLPLNIQKGVGTMGKYDLRSDICLTYTKLPSRQENLSFFFSLKGRQSVLPLSCLDSEILNWSLWKFWVWEPK